MRLVLLKIVMMGSLIGCLVGCFPILNCRAKNIIVSPEPAPNDCQYVGEITSRFEIDGLKNEALELCSNYVVLTENSLTYQQNSKGSDKFIYHAAGRAYHCPTPIRKQTMTDSSPDAGKNIKHAD